jgi:hypothetical protein
MDAVKEELPNTELEKLGGESRGQRWMEVENQEGQGPLWAVALLLNEWILFQYELLCIINPLKPSVIYHLL